jgi:hypothetical protein
LVEFERDLTERLYGRLNAAKKEAFLTPFFCVLDLCWRVFLCVPFSSDFDT